jgi:hypothetical protein
VSRLEGGTQVPCGLKSTLHRICLIVVGCLLLGACGSNLWYPPPAQKVMPSGPEPLPAASMLNMGEPSAQGGIIQDVLGPQAGVTWRWTNQHPRFRVWLDPQQKWDFVVRFTLPGAVLKAVGPVTLHMMVNEQELDTRKYDRDQDYRYSKPIPPQMLGSKDSAILGIDIDPIYVAPADGMKLGILLEEIGLTPSPVK